MQDSDIRKGFGKRLKELRKQRRWTQKEVADRIGVRFSHLNKYESGMHIPPVEKLLQLAEIFDTTIDYLLTGDHTDAQPLRSLRLLERMRALEGCSAEDQETAIKVLDALIVRQRVEGALAPLEKRAAGGAN